MPERNAELFMTVEHGLRIGGFRPETPLFLCPLAGYTDLPFRRLIRPLGGLGLAFTELVSPRGLREGARRSQEIVETADDDRPLAIQLYGTDAEALADAAAWAAERGSPIVDLNMGCPAPKIAGKGGGSGMLRECANAVRLAATVVQRCPAPVTVKTRLGWEQGNLVAQTELLVAARETATKMFVFHGRGGTPARGGGRTENLVEAVPDGAIRGILRLTEQGEVVNQSYGLRPIAMRTLERTFASVALATAHTGTRPPIPPTHRAAMQTIAARSLAVYRELIFGSAQFFEYFRAATPLDVIERMHIGSRPSARSDGSGVHALRAIPWVFAWTQSRHMLPGWFGFGSGLSAALDKHGADVVSQMVAHWPFFTHLLDDVEAMLGRTDLEIAGHYDALAGNALRAQAEPIAREYALTVAHVLSLRGSVRLLDSDPTLQRSIKLRNPYIDPMHLMQVDLLQRWRKTDREDRALFGALRATISGIAQGLQATG